MAEIESSDLAGSKRKYKMKCAVPNCETRAASGLEKFPTEPLLRYTWLTLIRPGFQVDPKTGGGAESALRV